MKSIVVFREKHLPGGSFVFRVRTELLKLLNVILNESLLTYN